MRRVLAITGMHRSGTSLTASWLQSCGLPIDLGGLVGPAIGNPRGHYEDVALMNLQRREILRRHPRSRGWKLHRSEFLQFSADGMSEAVRVLRERNDRFECWGWKDPRTVAFLPEWLRLEPELRVLMVWRPASSVLSSLVRRSRRSDNRDMRVSKGSALRTWIAYNELVCKFRNANPDRTMLIPLEHLLTRDQEAVDHLRERFNLPLTYVPITSNFEPGLLTASAREEALRGLAMRSQMQKALHVESTLNELSDL